MRRVSLGAVVAAIAAVNAVIIAITPGGHLSADQLQNSMNSTFANLYLQQQAALGRPDLDASGVSADTSCRRVGSSSPSAGAGDDWSCVVQWIGLYGVLQVASYDTKLRTNGCYTATGPVAVVGRPFITDSSGRTRVNPVYEFDGCVT